MLPVCFDMTYQGDIFKVTMNVKEGEVDRMMIKYFDTIPIATNLCILKAGFLDCATESGDRNLYELQSLGNDTPDPVFESTQFPVDPKAKFDAPFFQPRELTNLSPPQKLSSKNPIMDMEVANLAGEEAPQMIDARLTVCVWCTIFSFLSSLRYDSFFTTSMFRDASSLLLAFYPSLWRDNIHCRPSIRLVTIRSV